MMRHAGVVKLENTADSKSAACKGLRVRLPPPALQKSKADRAFEEFPWTPELAYAVGLLATDGNLSKDGRHVTMRSSDRELLESFRSCLGIQNNKIARTWHDEYAKRPCYRIQFSNVRFYKWLLAVGLTPAKTRTLGELKIPDEHFRDFLRGHLDGDGSIITYKDSYNTFKNPKYVYTRVWVKFCSASRAHLVWLRGTTSRLLGIQGHLNRTNQMCDLWCLKFGKHDSIRLLSWLYHDSSVPCLKRKRKIAEKFI